MHPDRIRSESFLKRAALRDIVLTRDKILQKNSNISQILLRFLKSIETPLLLQNLFSMTKNQSLKFKQRKIIMMILWR